MYCLWQMWGTHYWSMWGSLLFGLLHLCFVPTEEICFEYRYASMMTEYLPRSEGWPSALESGKNWMKWDIAFCQSLCTVPQSSNFGIKCGCWHDFPKYQVVYVSTMVGKIWQFMGLQRGQYISVSGICASMSQKQIKLLQWYLVQHP